MLQQLSHLRLLVCCYIWELLVLLAQAIVIQEAACLLQCTGGYLFASTHWRAVEASCLLLDTGGCLFDVSNRMLLVCCNTKEAA